jgi:hypothetical protein
MVKCEQRSGYGVGKGSRSYIEGYVYRHRPRLSTSTWTLGGLMPGSDTGNNGMVKQARYAVPGESVY